MTEAAVTAATPGYLSGAGSSTLAGPPIEVKDPPYEDTLYYEDTLWTDVPAAPGTVITTPEATPQGDLPGAVARSLDSKGVDAE
ncbi:hypothetical protein ACH4VM_27715 [Streptomyces sp. NPDC020792]|uniref:hypothetical protein n=1 Tax=Streptomyces sp. NPDC020792 TaxID=3365089 RepID=UPI00378D3174